MNFLLPEKAAPTVFRAKFRDATRAAGNEAECQYRSRRGPMLGTTFDQVELRNNLRRNGFQRQRTACAGPANAAKVVPFPTAIHKLSFSPTIPRRGVTAGTSMWNQSATAVRQ